MTKEDFNKMVADGISAIKAQREWNFDTETFVEDRKACKDVFNYGTWCEKNFEANLREDYKRKTTFTSDFSIAEWCECVEHGAVLDTFKRAITEWKDNIEYFAELLLALNMKSWEHHARKHKVWSALYAELFYLAKDLYFEWFDTSNSKHDKAMEYYYDYVD